MAQYYVVGWIGRSSRKVHKQRYASLYRREDTNSRADKERGLTHYITEVVASDLQMLGKREQGAKGEPDLTYNKYFVIDNDLPF